jgi:hypothetical protein
MLTLTLADNIDDHQITAYWNRLKASLRKHAYASPTHGSKSSPKKAGDTCTYYSTATYVKGS